jgi:putative membrane protein
VSPSPYAFSWEPLFVVAAALASGAYVRSARRAAIPWWRAALFALGIALVVAAVAGPIETIATHYLLLFHLLQNVMTADWAPPLLILGLTPAMRNAVARAGGRALSVLTRPKVALPLWLLTWFGVHLPVFYEFALRHPVALNLEHAVLLLAGLVFWWPLLSDEPNALSTPQKLAYLGVAFALSSFLGVAFIFSTTPFYDFYVDAPRLWGLSPAKDQNLGGILMNAEQTIVFLSALIYFVLRLLDEEQQQMLAQEQSRDRELRRRAASSP